jgi:hypothetical protein
LRRAATLLLVAALVPSLAGCFGGGSKSRKAALNTSTGSAAEAEPPSRPSNPDQSTSAELPSVQGGGGSAPKQESGPPHWESNDSPGRNADAAPVPDKPGTVARGVETPPVTAPAHDFKTLADAVAAGNLDRAVAETLEQQGSVEAIVTFDYQSTINDAKQKAPKGEGRDKAIIGATRDGFNAKKDDVLVGRRGAKVLRKWEYLPTSFVEFDSAEALLAVLNQPGVLAVSADRKLQVDSNQHLNYIRQPEAQQGGYIGSGTYVGVIDTGVNYTLSDFGSCPPLGTTSCRVQSYSKVVSGDSTTLDDNGHGSNVAGIVTQVAPGTKILAYDAFAGASTGYQYVNTALNDLVRLKDQGLRVAAVNMSIGQYNFGTDVSCPTTGYSSIQTVYSDGIIPVVSTGNNAGGGTVNWGVSNPACAPAALSVGATYDYNVGGQTWNFAGVTCTDSTSYADKVACFSQTGPTLRMVAPGTQIGAAGTTYTGTSQAAPHVAGAAAVLAAAVPAARVDQIWTALVGSGPLVTDQRYAGYPAITVHRLDLPAARAALAAAVNPGDTTAPTVSAPTQRIDGQMTSQTVPVMESWSASDPSGIKAYSVLYTTNGGSSWTQVALPTATTTANRLALSIGQSYAFAVAAQDGANNWSGYAIGPTFKVDAQDDTSSAVSCTGSWPRIAWTEAFGGYEVTSSAAGATCKFGPFTGRAVGFVAPFFSTSGQVKIYVDGTYQRTIDLYNASLYPRWVADSYWWTSSGSHTITVQVVGTSGRPRVDVDAFAVLR